MAEEAGSGGFEETVGVEEGDQLYVAEPSRFFKTIHGLIDPEQAVGVTRPVHLKEGEDDKTTGQDCGGVSIRVDTDELRDGKGGTKIEVGEVHRAKEGTGGHHRV